MAFKKVFSSKSLFNLTVLFIHAHAIYLFLKLIQVIAKEFQRLSPGVVFKGHLCVCVCVCVWEHREDDVMTCHVILKGHLSVSINRNICHDCMVFDDHS